MTARSPRPPASRSMTRTRAAALREWNARLAPCTPAPTTTTSADVLTARSAGQVHEAAVVD